jgi:hypothetical protein
VSVETLHPDAVSSVLVESIDHRLSYVDIAQSQFRVFLGAALVTPILDDESVNHHSLGGQVLHTSDCQQSTVCVYVFTCACAQDTRSTSQNSLATRPQLSPGILGLGEKCAHANFITRIILHKDRSNWRPHSNE